MAQHGDESTNKENVELTKEVRTRCIYTAADKALLVDFLLEQQEAGMQADNNFKPAVWTMAPIKLNEKLSQGAPKTSGSCKAQFQSLSRAFRLVQVLRGKSGVGWDDGEKHITAPDDVWDALIKSNKSFKPFKKQPFELYDEMDRLISGKSANGRGALSISTLLGGNILTTQPTSSQETEIATDDGVEDMETARVSALDMTESDDETEQTQAPTALAPERGRKRAPSAEPTDDQCPSKRKSMRPSAPAAVTDMANAIRELGSSLEKAQNDPFPPTPKWLTDTIKHAQQDDKLDVKERTKLMGLFMEKMAVADAYLAFDDKDIRTAFVRRFINGL